MDQPFIKMQVEQSERYETAKKKALFNLKKGLHLGGQQITGREELHDRKRIILLHRFRRD
jgi:hypothetical protein